MAYRVESARARITNHLKRFPGMTNMQLARSLGMNPGHVAAVTCREWKAGRLKRIEDGDVLPHRYVLADPNV